MIAVGAVRRHGVVLVQIERHDAREVHLTRLMAADQLTVDPEWGAPGGKPQHAAPLRGRLASDHLDDVIGEPQCEVVVIRDDDGRDVLAIARTLDRAARGTMVAQPMEGRGRRGGRGPGSLGARHLKYLSFIGQRFLPIQ